MLDSREEEKKGREERKESSTSRCCDHVKVICMPQRIEESRSRSRREPIVYAIQYSLCIRHCSIPMCSFGPPPSLSSIEVSLSGCSVEEEKLKKVKDNK